MRHGFWILLFTSATLGACAWLASPEPGRRVEGNTLVSEASPDLRLTVEPELAFRGRQDFELFESAEVEQYVFASDDGGVARRFLLVQFERFLPSNDYTYEYLESDPTMFGDAAFVHLSGPLDLATFVQVEPFNDASRAVELLRNQGLATPQAVLSSRFVRVLGEDKRSELVLAYYEDATLHGLDPKDVGEGGDVEWRRAADAAKERAVAALELKMAP